MSDLKPNGNATGVRLGGETYGMLFTLNAIDDIQDHFQIDIENLADLFRDREEDGHTVRNRNKVRNLCWILAKLINEWIDCEKDAGNPERSPVDDRFIGRHINAANWTSMANRILESFKASTPEHEDDDDIDPNVASE